MLNPSDEIKAKLDIVEVVREYVPLKAAGYNFRANCPFHREKTPSFMVSPEKQIWHCFGCGKGGDVFSFVMEIEGLSFVEALRLLAKKAGVILKQANPALASKRNVLLDITELAAKFYHKFLLASPAAEKARRYLRERKLTGDTIANWQIGYSPDSWDSLINFLRSKGFQENEIFLAGLSVKKDGAQNFYDRFRGRIMFPINDINGNAVGFTARVSPEKEATEKMGKYINTPATMIYDKSKILFGLDKAKLAVKTQDAAVLVEGQMDAIMAHQHGFANTVASSGTALTAEQISLLKRYTNNIYLSFDADAAGELAAERGLAQAMAAEMSIKVIELAEAKDPDECLKKNPDAWRQAVAAAKPVMAYYFGKIFGKFDKNNYDGQNQAVKKLLPAIAKFGSKLEQDYWLKKLSQEVDANENSLREKLNEIRQLADKKQRPAAIPAKAAETSKTPAGGLERSREAKLSESLLALALRYPAHLEYLINHLTEEALIGEDVKLLYKNLVIYYNKLIDFWTRQGGNFDLAINYQELKDWLNNLESSDADHDYEAHGQASNSCACLLDRLMLLADKDFFDYSEEQAKVEIINLLGALKINYLTNRRRQIVKLIAAAEKENLSPEAKAGKLKNLLEEFNILTGEINLIEIK